MSAIISDCGTYRYLLTREISLAGTGHSAELLRRVLLFIMLNPSTADATLNDATITRLIAYAKAWGYGRLEVVNLFAYRATDPKLLKNASHIAVGPDNDVHIRAAVQRADTVVCAWGTHGTLLNRDVIVSKMLMEHNGPGLYALKETRYGHPSHPLYLRADLTPKPFKTRGLIGQ